MTAQTAEMKPIPKNEPDPGLCGVRWCGETLNHDGPHRQQILDDFGINVQTARPTIFQLWLQGESARVRTIAVVVGGQEIGLTWRQVGRIAHALARAVSKWGPDGGR